MSSHEDLFESSVLEVIAPPPSLEFPTGYSDEKAMDWISRMQNASKDRTTAFFGTSSFVPSQHGTHYQLNALNR